MSLSLSLFTTLDTLALNEKQKKTKISDNISNSKIVTAAREEKKNFNENCAVSGMAEKKTLSLSGYEQTVRCDRPVSNHDLPESKHRMKIARCERDQTNTCARASAQRRQRRESKVRQKETARRVCNSFDPKRQRSIARFFCIEHNTCASAACGADGRTHTFGSLPIDRSRTETHKAALLGMPCLENIVFIHCWRAYAVRRYLFRRCPSSTCFAHAHSRARARSERERPTQRFNLRDGSHLSSLLFPSLAGFVVCCYLRALLRLTFAPTRSDGARTTGRRSARHNMLRCDRLMSSTGGLFGPSARCEHHDADAICTLRNVREHHDPNPSPFDRTQEEDQRITAERIQRN